MAIGQGQEKELLLSENYNFRSLNQKIGKKPGPKALIRLACASLATPPVKLYILLADTLSP